LKLARRPSEVAKSSQIQAHHLKQKTQFMSESTIRPAIITGIIPDSIAAEMGFTPGDRLVKINGQKPRDLIDYQFLCSDEVLDLEIVDAKGKAHQIEIEKDCDEDLGLEFESALFDGLIQCNNKCPFCFIDQQPPGKRESLYFKDDDYRLSFLYGSYLTLTNLTTREWDRIAQMRLSPLYVSVHATEPEIRSQLLKNARAGEIMTQLAWFQSHRLEIHAQVVLCPGINDGIHLDRTIRDLASFHYSDTPAVASVAVVPVGLTRFRPNLTELSPVTSATAKVVIAQVEAFQQKFKQEFGSNFVWLADEWYLIAGIDLPPSEYYEDYPQLGNGVGSIRRFLDEFAEEIADWEVTEINPPHTCTWVVGNAVENAFQPIVKQLNQVSGLTVNLVAIASQYWGQQMTVTGLLTGQDLLDELPGRDLGDRVLIPSVMLKHDEDKFLDDVTLSQLAEKLQIPFIPVSGIPNFLDQLAETKLVSGTSPQL
jgi:putative radical SAM enzyme (TIGR03279 family)